VSFPASDSIPGIASDPDDDPVILTAVRGQADVLCTLDRHLYDPKVRAYCTQRNIDVLTDTELLQQLRRRRRLAA
jgi:predicted nucleic acid-binding protein